MASKGSKTVRYPYITYEPAITAPAMPAPAPFPKTAAMAKAMEPVTRDRTSSPMANPAAAAGAMGSPGSTPYTTPVTHVARPASVTTAASAVTCARTFARATRRRVDGPARTMSRLPRAASPASVDESASSDHSPPMSAKYGP